jgi:O-antigen/teichoic acid export membrane protein
MKFSYLLAVISNRMLTLLCVLALSHILSGSEFGAYAIMAINALLIHTLAGNWLAMSTTQVLATDSSQDHGATFARILKAAVAIMLLECGLAVVVFALRWFTSIAIGLDEIAATLAFAVAMLLFDVATAAKNALGDDRNYMRFNLLRNVGGSLFALVFAWSGGNAALVLSGQTIGIMLAFVLSGSALGRWKSGFVVWRKTKLQLRQWFQMLAFGMTGTLALGLLILVNSLTRNFVLLVDGSQMAGIYSLIGDLVNAPLVLLGTSYSLSKMRQLYQLALLEPAKRIAVYRQFVGAIAFLAIPYGVGGYFVAPIIAKYIVPTDMAATAAAIAGLAAAQSATLTIVSTSITILLTAGQKRKTLLLVAGTLLPMLAACVGGWAMGGGTAFASATLFGSIVAVLASIAILRMPVFPWHKLARIMLASAIMAGVVMVTLQADNLLWAVAATVLGIFAFAVSAFFLKVTDWRELMPARTDVITNP